MKKKKCFVWLAFLCLLGASPLIAMNNQDNDLNYMDYPDELPDDPNMTPLERQLRRVERFERRQAVDAHNRYVNQERRRRQLIRAAAGGDLVAQRDLERHERRMDRELERGDKLHDAGVRIQEKAVGMFLDQLGAAENQERNERLAAIKANQERQATVEAAQKYVDFLKDNPKKIVGIATGVSGGVFGLYFLAKHGLPYVFDQLQKPELADSDKTSVQFGFSGWVKSAFYGIPKAEGSLSDVVLEPSLAVRISELVASLKNTVENGGFLRNLMLWGQPGTGKTMLAMRMARACGLDYIYFSGSNLMAFDDEEALRQAIQLFRYAKNSPNKLMIIIDEAEAILGRRSNPNMSEKARKLLTAILTYTGTESRDYMVTIMTNRPEDIDEAFLSRCGQRIEIAAPAPKERRAIVQYYADYYLIKAANFVPTPPSVFSMKYWFSEEKVVTPPAIETGALSSEALDKVSERLVGFVGRDISDLFSYIQASVYATEDKKVTTDLMNRCIDEKIKEMKEKEEGFKRTTQAA